MAPPSIKAAQRAAIYARYSSDLQSPKSIDDQVSVCRAYAVQQGFIVAKVYSDAAKSGASTASRFGWQDLMTDAAERRFEVIIAEDSDRITRDQADWHDLVKRLRFFGVQIHGVHSGVIRGIEATVKAWQSENYLEKLAEQVHRGQAGAVREGRHAGGKAYGYRPVLGKPGEFEIVEEEAAIIRRIFEAAKAGRSPRDIAGELNREGVKSPRGGRWNASSINGSRQRGNGILHNPLYVGRLVWNRLRMVKHPDTGKRLSIARPESEWQTVDVPHLLIVPTDLFNAVQKQPIPLGNHGDSEGHRLVGQRRRASYLLSGLLRCAACGGSMVSQGRDRSGKVRIRCSTATESGACDHRRRYYLDEIETLSLGGLRDELREPALIKHFLDTYVAEQQKLLRGAVSRRAKLEQRRGELKRRMRRIIDSILEGVPGHVVAAEATAVDADLAEVEAALAQAAEAPPLITLHPATQASYLAKVEKLSEGRDTESTSAVRELIESVTVYPAAAGEPLRIKLNGYLANLTGQPIPPNRQHASVLRPVDSSGSGGGS